jgi:hypothetical protein
MLDRVPERATYVYFPDGGELPKMARGDYQDPNSPVHSAHAVAPLTDGEHAVAEIFWDKAAKIYPINHGNATIVLGWAAAYAAKHTPLHVPQPRMV